jgi:hypothetical protein
MTLHDIIKFNIDIIKVQSVCSREERWLQLMPVPVYHVRVSSKWKKMATEDEINF